jgi:hypothetical protein
LDYIIAIALIRGETCLKYKFLSEVCFGMIISYFAIDIVDIYGPPRVYNRNPKKHTLSMYQGINVKIDYVCGIPEI